MGCTLNSETRVPRVNDVAGGLRQRLLNPTREASAGNIPLGNPVENRPLNCWLSPPPATVKLVPPAPLGRPREMLCRALRSWLSSAWQRGH